MMGNNLPTLDFTRAEDGFWRKISYNIVSWAIYPREVNYIKVNLFKIHLIISHDGQISIATKRASNRERPPVHSRQDWA